MTGRLSHLDALETIRRDLMEEWMLISEAKLFLDELHRQFEKSRRELMEIRKIKEQNLQEDGKLDFREDTRLIRDGVWSVAPIPKDLQDRRLEITGPAEPKMIINALNSGAKVFMADFEDALSPT